MQQFSYLVSFFLDEDFVVFHSFSVIISVDAGVVEMRLHFFDETFILVCFQHQEREEEMERQERGRDRREGETGEGERERRENLRRSTLLPEIICMELLAFVISILGTGSATHYSF